MDKLMPALDTPAPHRTNRILDQMRVLTAGKRLVGLCVDHDSSIAEVEGTTPYGTIGTIGTIWHLGLRAFFSYPKMKVAEDSELPSLT